MEDAGTETKPKTTTTTTTWPSLTRAFRRFLGDKTAIGAWREEMGLAAKQKQQAQDDAKAQAIRGPVSLVVAVLRTVSRTLAPPLAALEGSDTMNIAAKLVHSVLILVLMALVYVLYTKTTFAAVTEEHTYVITTTLAWLACFLLIVWLTG